MKLDDIERWSSGAAPPALRALLRSTADDGPSAADLAGLERRLRPLLAPAMAPPARSAHWALRARTWLVVAAVIGAGVASYGLSRSHAPDPPRAAAQPPLAMTEPPAPTVAPTEVPAPPVPAAPVAPKHVPKHAERSTIAKPETKPALATSEVELLEEGRRALRAGDAARALALTAVHAQQFPDGVLVEEREAIAIEALVKLERNDDARARWARFASAYPSSNYRGRLQRLMDVQPSR